MIKKLCCGSHCFSFASILEKTISMEKNKALHYVKYKASFKKTMSG